MHATLGMTRSATWQHRYTPQLHERGLGDDAELYLVHSRGAVGESKEDRRSGLANDANLQTESPGLLLTVVRGCRALSRDRKALTYKGAWRCHLTHGGLADVDVVRHLLAACLSHRML